MYMRRCVIYILPCCMRSCLIVRGRKLPLLESLLWTTYKSSLTCLALAWNLKSAMKKIIALEGDHREIIVVVEILESNFRFLYRLNRKKRSLERLKIYLFTKLFTSHAMINYVDWESRLIAWNNTEIAYF